MSSNEEIQGKMAKVMANMPKGYIAREDSIFKVTYKDKQPTEERLCDFMAVTKISRDADTHEQILTIYYKSGADGFFEKSVPTNQINSRSIEDLSNYGVDVNAQNKNAVNRYLMESRKLLKSEIHYKDIGWIRIEDQQVYASNKVIVPDDMFSNAKLESEIELTPKGVHYSINDENSPIYSDISTNKNLQLAIVLGLSASILPVIRQEATDLNSMIYSLTGFSSSGKTSAAKLALSVAGRPSGVNSLFGTWSSTLNAISARLNGNFGG